MITATDVAREIGASRQAEAQHSVLEARARLARRQQRLHHRIQRINKRLTEL